METLFVTESRELLFTGTEDIDVRPLPFAGAALRGRQPGGGAAGGARGRGGLQGRGLPARFRPVGRHRERNHARRRGVHGKRGDGQHRRSARPRARAAHARARGGRETRGPGRSSRDIAGHTEPVGSARCGGDIYSLYRVEGSAFGDFTCYRVGRAPYNGTLYLPAGFHDYGIATLRGLFAALEGGQCEYLCEYQDEIDGVYHGLFEKRI